jgi:ketosteroid isomerase-like protein
MAMTIQSEAPVRDQIRALLDDRAAAIAAGDADRVVALYAPRVESFRLIPPLRYGDEVRDPADFAGWARMWAAPPHYDIGEPTIQAAQDVAYCHGLTHVTGIKADGERVDMWFRSTIGFIRTDGGWRIAHEHDSTPFYVDGTGRAATDLRP